MYTGLNPFLDRSRCRTIASATSLFAWVQVSMTLLYRSPLEMKPGRIGALEAGHLLVR